MKMRTFLVNAMVSTFALGAIMAPSLAAAQFHGHGGGHHGGHGMGGHGGGFHAGGGGYHGGYYPGGGYGGGGYGYGAAAGVAALATGALIGGAVASHDQGYYPPYGDAAPAYGGDAVAYCQQTYRSYNPATGSYLGYDGVRYACP
jgi:BA14K-like protein